MADTDKRPAEEKAISDAVDKAVEQHGPLATVQMVERKLAEVRRVDLGRDFPKAKYGPNGETRTVNSRAEEKDLGKGWGDAPADEHRDRQGVASGAVAQTTERVEAEAALRRAAYLANPADSTAHSALHGSGVVVSANTTTDVPGQPVPLTAAGTAPDGKPAAVAPAPTPPPPAPPPAPPADNPKATA